MDEFNRFGISKSRRKCTSASADNAGNKMLDTTLPSVNSSEGEDLVMALHQTQSDFFNNSFCFYFNKTGCFQYDAFISIY